MHENDLVLGQGAGLVGAQDIHRPEVLDRVEALDDHPLTRHRDGALGQIDGHDHRQHLGCQPDRDGERKHQRLQPVALGHSIDDKDARHHDRHEADHQPGKAGDALVEAGLRALPYQHPGELAEIGPGAGLDNDSGSRAAQHIAAHEADIRQVGRRAAAALNRRRRFLDRHRLPGKRCLVQEQIFRGEHTQICRDHVAGGKPHDIAGNELLDRNL